MYNFYLSDRALKRQNETEKLKKHEIDRVSSKRERQERLIHNYKKRVENFVMQMLEKPIKYNQFRGQETHRFRDEDASKFKGGPAILVKSVKTERDRIRESIEKNKEYLADHVEFSNHEFRKRDPSREIQPQMHFSTKSGLDRIASKLGSMKTALDSDAKRFDQNESFLLELSKSPVKATNRYIAKHFMAELHQKTHFKAAESLYLALPDGLVDQQSLDTRRNSKHDKLPSVRRATNTLGEEATPTNTRIKLPLNLNGILMKDSAKDAAGIEPMENEEYQKVAGKNLNIDNVNPVEISKKILLNCNFIRSKPLSVRTLHVGEGHLSMSPQKSVREIYHDVYHRDFVSPSTFKNAMYSP